MSQCKTKCLYCGELIPANELGGFAEYHNCQSELDTAIGGDMGGMYTDQVMEDTRERLTKGIMETCTIQEKAFIQSLDDKQLRDVITLCQEELMNRAEIKFGTKQ